MDILFTPANISSLRLPNQLVRVATAKRMADDNNGQPQPRLAELYRQLTRLTGSLNGGGEFGDHDFISKSWLQLRMHYQK